MEIQGEGKQTGAKGLNSSISSEMEVENQRKDASLPSLKRLIQKGIESERKSDIHLQSGSSKIPKISTDA